jgi:hypothetical protein
MWEPPIEDSIRFLSICKSVAFILRYVRVRVAYPTNLNVAFNLWKSIARGWQQQLTHFRQMYACGVHYGTARRGWLEAPWSGSYWHNPPLSAVNPTNISSLWAAISPLRLLTGTRWVAYLAANWPPKLESQIPNQANTRKENLCLERNFSWHSRSFRQLHYKGKAIPATGNWGPQGCETSRHPHFLDSRLTDGREVVSLMRRSSFTPKKIPGTHFCYSLSRSQGHTAAERIRSIKKYKELIRNRTRDLRACTIVPQTTSLPRGPTTIQTSAKLNYLVNFNAASTKTERTEVAYQLKHKCASWTGKPKLRFSFLNQQRIT